MTERPKMADASEAEEPVADGDDGPAEEGERAPDFRDALRLMVDRMSHLIVKRDKADPERVPADHDDVQALQGGGEPSQFAPDAGGEILDGVPGFRSVRGFELAHVAGHAGQALEAAAMVEQIREGGGVHATLGHEEQQHARIELPAARPHRQPVQGREAHGGGHRPAVPDRAHGGARAEVRDHDPHVALYGGGPDGLAVPAQVVSAARGCCVPGGCS